MSNAFLDVASERLNSRLDRLSRLVDQVENRARADASQRLDEMEAQRLKDRQRRSEIQSRYDDVFRKFGERAPMAVADDAPRDYRRHLFGIAQNLLPRGHEMRAFKADEIGPSAIAPMEQQLFEALSQEAETPSLANLPRDGSMISRTKVNPVTNARETHWLGRESFISQMMRPARRVVAFHDRDGRIIFPARARGL
jgi:hypothetical protein